jgi:hypothetical protein
MPLQHQRNSVFPGCVEAAWAGYYRLMINKHHARNGLQPRIKKDVARSGSRPSAGTKVWKRRRAGGSYRIAIRGTQPRENFRACPEFATTSSRREFRRGAESA